MSDSVVTMKSQWTVSPRMKCILCQGLKRSLLPWPMVTCFPSWTYPMHVYVQLQLDEASQEYVIINTHWCTRLPCGIKPCHLPVHHRDSTQRFTNGRCLSWQYPGKWKITGRTLCWFGTSVAMSWRCRGEIEDRKVFLLLIRVKTVGHSTCQNLKTPSIGHKYHYLCSNTSVFQR